MSKLATEQHRDSAATGSGSISSTKPMRRTIKVKVDSAGRVLVPAPFRKALAFEPGDEVKMVLKDGMLEIRSLDDAVREAQALVRRHVSRKNSLVRELIQERRKEAKSE